MNEGVTIELCIFEPKDTTRHVTITIGTADKAPLSLSTFSQPSLAEAQSAIIRHFGVHSYDEIQTNILILQVSFRCHVTRVALYT
jgi:hypothetical protein